MSDPAAAPNAARERRRALRRAARDLRAAAVLLLLLVLGTGLAYPAVLTGIAAAVTPASAGGSLVYLNGTAIGSAFVAQNLSRPFLFWARPSPADYNATLGPPSPPGIETPAYRALLNETLSYMRSYGEYTVNASLPLSWVGISGSGLDPDLTPQAVLVQVLRVRQAVANLTHTNVSLGAIRALVNRAIVPSPLPDYSTPYVNVLQLDVTLLHAYPGLFRYLPGV